MRNLAIAFVFSGIGPMFVAEALLRMTARFGMIVPAVFFAVPCIAAIRAAKAYL